MSPLQLGLHHNLSPWEVWRGQLSYLTQKFMFRILLPFFEKQKKNNTGRNSTENDHHLTLSTFFYHLHSISCSRHSLLILINFIISFRLQIINVLLIRSMLRLKRRTTKLGMLEHFNLLIAIILF